MTGCPRCGQGVPGGPPGTSLRGPEGLYHLACAPSALLEGAQEEWEAILRKGIRYFLAKYSAEAPPGGPGTKLGEDFLAFGKALTAELRRRQGPG